MKRTTQNKSQIDADWLIVEKSRIDPRLFAPIYEKYFDHIFIFIHRRVYQEAIAGDLTSNVFLKALTHLDRCKNMGLPYSAWLYRIAMNEVNSFYRKTNKQRVVNLEESGIEHILQHWEPCIEKEEALNQMMNSLSILKVEELELIKLRYFEEKDLKEISFILNLSMSNTKVKLFRVIQKLRQYLVDKRVSK